MGVHRARRKLRRAPRARVDSNLLRRAGPSSRRYRLGKGSARSRKLLRLASLMRTVSKAGFVRESTGRHVWLNGISTAGSVSASPQHSAEPAKDRLNGAL